MRCYLYGGNRRGMIGLDHNLVGTKIFIPDENGGIEIYELDKSRRGVYKEPGWMSEDVIIYKYSGRK